MERPEAREETTARRKREPQAFGCGSVARQDKKSFRSVIRSIEKRHDLNTAKKMAIIM
jgi:hypothetical protein